MGRKHRENVYKLNPSLAQDPNFKITSPINRQYNCLAWALNRKDVWMWPIENPDEDDYYWPEGVDFNTKQETFIKAFEIEGFQICETSDLEEGYEKIALYGYAGFAFHATRQLPSGLWTSKNGHSYDIQHSTPQTMECNAYGKVYCYMKRKK